VSLNFFKKASYVACKISGLTPWRFKAFASHATILLYHRVIRQTHNRFCPNASIEVPFSSFEKQMSFLAERCHVVSLEECLERLAENAKLPPNTVVLTFDDGYRSDYELVYPLLKRHQFPATFYIVPGFVDGQIFPWWYEVEDLIVQCDRRNCVVPFEKRPRDLRQAGQKLTSHRRIAARMRTMPLRERRVFLARLRDCLARPEWHPDRLDLMLTWEQIKEMSDSKLVQVGAHTARHLNLAKESRETVREEISRSKNILKERLGKPVRAFAYPYGHSGSFTQDTQDAVKAHGFTSGVSTVAGHLNPEVSIHPWRLPRIHVDGRDDLAAFQAKLSGIYWFIKSTLPMAGAS
jgi:peptidoglycan/xylan/chitin deacetylase (PgdA/CDA1 family)